MIRSGYRLPWGPFKAPLRLSPPTFRPPQDSQAWEALDSEVSSLLSKGAVEEADPNSPGFYGRLFVVPKSSGGLRPVLDLSALNRFLRPLHFRMETPSSIRDSIHKGDYAASIDLQDAYFHILIHPRHRKWLRFSWNGRVFQFRALPFGLAPAPWIFSKVVRELCIALRRLGIRIKVYLDDWLILASRSTICSQHIQTVITWCNRLGFIPNYGKSELIPDQQFTFLGIHFDTVAWTVSPSDQRILRLQTSLSLLLRQRQASASALASLLGSMESLSLVLPLGRLHKRQFQRAFRLRWSQALQSWHHKIQLGHWFKSTVAQWMDSNWLHEGVPLTLRPPQEFLFTDASTKGWGAHMGSLSASGVWTTFQQTLHINLLELEAVALALKEFLPAVKGKHILVHTDNTTVLYYLNRQGGARSVSLSVEAENLLLWCQHYKITLSAKHISGKLNVLADLLSRAHTVLHTEWTLDRKVLRPVWELWFKPQVDLFATKFSNRLPTYVSPVPDPEAWQIDALSIPWRHFLGYAFPPIPLLGKVLKKAREEQATLILVAPMWPAQAWFPELLFLSHVPPLKLYIGPRSLRQPRSGIPHASPQVLDLHAWLLCGKHCLH